MNARSVHNTCESNGIFFIFINIIRFSGERVSNVQIMYHTVLDTFLEIGH